MTSTEPVTYSQDAVVLLADDGLLLILLPDLDGLRPDAGERDRAGLEDQDLLRGLRGLNHQLEGLLAHVNDGLGLQRHVGAGLKKNQTEIGEKY